MTLHVQGVRHRAAQATAHQSVCALVADVVVFGHSHAPVKRSWRGGELLFNPGSPTLRRAQPAHSLGQLVLEGGSVVERRLVILE